MIFYSRTKTLRRWLTFRNMYILITNIIFLVALILRSINNIYSKIVYAFKAPPGPILCLIMGRGGGGVKKFERAHGGTPNTPPEP